MAHNIHPMDIDSIDGDFDKENAFHSNMLSRASCTETGYEELDVSELNMKLRYSFTPNSSLMSKSYTANCSNNMHTESGNNSLNNTLVNENANLTHSLNSMMSKSDIAMKSPRPLPLQVLPQEQLADTNGNDSVLRILDDTKTIGNANLTVTISGTNDNDENVSIPSLSSSATHSPEATTPTKEDPKREAGSPIIRGLKSVLNMFRPSQSPIPPPEENKPTDQDTLSPPIVSSPSNDNRDKPRVHTVLASTPIAAYKKREISSKKNSPHKDSIIFNDDLERELEWKDETTIIFSQEKIPVHKLFFHNKLTESSTNMEKNDANEKLNCTVEHMDISYNELFIKDKTFTETQPLKSCKLTENIPESDSEFVDCETFSKNESQTDPNETIILTDTNFDSVNVISGKNLPSVIPFVTNVISGDNKYGEFDATKESTRAIKICDGTEETVKNVVPTEEHKIVPEERNDTFRFPNQIISSMSTATLNDSCSEIVKENLDITKTLERESVLVTEVLQHESNLPTEIIKSEFNSVNLEENIGVNLDHPIVVSTEEFTEVGHFYDNQIITQPADIPLPDEDDIDKDIVLSSVKEIKTDCFNYMAVPVNVENNLNNNNIEIYAENKEIREPNLINDVIINNKLKNLDEIQVEVKEAVKHASVIEIDSDKEKQNVVLIYNKDDNTENVEITSQQEKVHIEENKKEDLEPMDISMFFEEDQNVNEMKPPSTTNVIKQYVDNDVVTISCDEVFVRDLAAQENVKSLSNYNEHDVKTETMNSVQENIDLKLCSDSLETSIPTFEIKSPLDTKVKYSENSSDLPAITYVNKFTVHCVESSPYSVPMNSDELTNGNVSMLENKADSIQEIDKTTFNHDVDCKKEPIDAMVNDQQNEYNEKKDRNPVITEEVHVKKTPEFMITDDTENVVQIVEETVSGSSSPYISVTGELESTSPKNKIVNNSIELENPLFTNTETTISPPSSPKITSTGCYNFNFEELDDPFATKTKVRISPPPAASPKECFQLRNNRKIIEKAEPLKREIIKNRRKSQPESNKNTLINRKNFNKTLDIASKNLVNLSNKGSETLVTDVEFKLENDLKSNLPDITEQQSKNEVTIAITHIKDNNIIEEIKPEVTETSVQDMNMNEKLKSVVHDDTAELKESLENGVYVTPNYVGDKTRTLNGCPADVNKVSVEVISAATEKSNMSSLEHSVYYSAGASSNESIQSKSVFNIPEIDDMKFNPFIAKSKIHRSSPPRLETDNPFVTRSKIESSPDSSIKVSQNAANKEDAVVYTEVNQIDVARNSSTTNSDTVPENNASDNINNLTYSSNTDNKEIIVRELNTEDEDTVEGPFLEAEEINNVDEISKCDSEKVDIQFNILPTQEVEENSDAGELFIDAEAFDFLMNQNKSTEVVDNGRESLFLKFDPLFAKRVNSDGVVEALSKIQKRQSTPKKVFRPQQQNMTIEKSPVGDFLSSNINHVTNIDNLTEENSEDLNVTVSKPMMVVTPAVNSIATPRNRSITPRSNRLSMTLSSPAIAAIDRILSLSANNSPVSHDITSHVNQQNIEADMALTQLRESLAEKEIHVHNLKTCNKELMDRLSTLESQTERLETESSERLRNINKLNEILAEKTKANKMMAAVVEEYERTIASLIAQNEQERKLHAEERIKLIKERDEQTAHLASMEISFFDLHSKYEKSKQVILGYKANEDSYRQSIKELEDNITKILKNYELLKQHATSKLNHANQELEKINRAHEAEVLKLNAMMKRKELHITSLEETLVQKSKANEELTAICDELINKVS